MRKASRRHGATVPARRPAPVRARAGACCCWPRASAPAAASTCSAARTTLPPDEPADKLYNEGLYLLNDKHDPKEAAKKFEEVDRQHPYSEWARKALLMSAYANYEAGEYDDAITAAKRYITLHPGSPDAAYAQYLIGSSYFDQIPDVTRDQARTEKAIAALDEVVAQISRTPNTPSSAKQKIEIARDQLAGKEMDDRPLLPGAARISPARSTASRSWSRKYQTTRHVEEALMRLTEAYMALGIVAGGADRGRRARPQFPGQPLVQGRLYAGEDRRPRADREQGLLDQPGVQEGRAGLRLGVAGGIALCHARDQARASSDAAVFLCKSHCGGYRIVRFRG